MTNYILDNIYCLLLMSEAERLNIIDTSEYKEVVIKLLKVYERSEDEADNQH